MLMLKLRVYVGREEKEMMLVAMIAQGRVPENPYAIELAHLLQTGSIDGRFHWGKAFQGVTARHAHCQLVQKMYIPFSHVSK